MPLDTKLPWFWICQSITVHIYMPLALNMPEFCICLWFWMCQVSEYAKFTKGSQYFWIIPQYFWLSLDIAECPYVCLNIPDYEWINKVCLNGFCFAFLHFKFTVTIMGQWGWWVGENLDIPFLILSSWFRITIITKQLIVLPVINQYFLQNFTKRDIITRNCCF